MLMELWKITCIPSLCSCILSFDVQIPHFAPNIFFYTSDDKGDSFFVYLFILLPSCGEYHLTPDQCILLFKILTDKHIGKRSLGKSRLRYEDNDTIYLKEISENMRNWIYSAQGGYWSALFNMRLKLQVP